MTTLRLSVALLGATFSMISALAQTTPNEISVHLTERSLKGDHHLYQRWFATKDSNCQVYVKKDGSIVALGEDDHYKGKNELLTENISIWVDRANGPQMKIERILMTSDHAMSVVPREFGYAVFWKNCQEAVNRDVPADIKAKFYGFFAVK